MSTAFSSPQDSQRVSEILDESDTFRVVIRGTAIIEEELKKVVDAAFREGIPAGLKGLHVRYQLALAEALGFVSPEVVAAINELRGIQHRLAQGSNEEVTPDDLRALRKAVEHIYGKDLQGLEGTDANQLAYFVYAIWFALGSDAEYAIRKRAEADEALASRKMKGVPLDVIKKPLESDASGV